MRRPGREELHVRRSSSLGLASTAPESKSSLLGLELVGYDDRDERSASRIHSVPILQQQPKSSQTLSSLHSLPASLGSTPEHQRIVSIRKGSSLQQEQPNNVTVLTDTARTATTPPVGTSRVSLSHFIVLFPQRKAYEHFHIPTNTAIKALKQMVVKSFLFSSSSSSSFTPATFSGSGSCREASPRANAPQRPELVNEGSEYSLFVPFRNPNFPAMGGQRFTRDLNNDEQGANDNLNSQEEEGSDLPLFCFSFCLLQP